MPLRKGAALLFLVAPVLWAASFIPFLGILAALPFSDTVLAGAALLVAGLLPLRRAIQVAIAVLLWATGSLSLLLLDGRMHLEHGGGVLWPSTQLTRTLPLPRGALLPVHGDAGAWLSAAGGSHSVAMEVNVAGMRASAGVPQINMATTVEPVDLIWRSGLVPNLGGPGFPRLVIERKASPGWTHVYLRAESGPGQVSGEFRRSYPLPPPESGVRPSAIKRLFLSVLHDNLVRVVLGLNERYDAYRDFGEFMGVAFGSRSRHDGDGAGPFRKMAVISDHEESTVFGARSVEEVLADIAQPGAPNLRYTREEPCGWLVSGREFGADGWRTYAALLDGVEAARPIILNHITPGHATFAWYCDQATGRVLGFMDASERASLRVTGYTPQGVIAEVHYFELPFHLHHLSVVRAGSLRRGAAGELAFTVVLPVKAGPDGKDVRDRVRVLEVSGERLH